MQMSDDSRSAGLDRRAFLSAAAGSLPAAAILSPVDLMDRMAATGVRRRDDFVRLGIIGAGENVRDVQIPGFRRIPECEIVAVANSSLESSQRVAQEFGIPRAYANWRELLDDEELNAVLIGTPPYMHHNLTLAAIETGKHVLCQARMANNAQEAREMLEASRRRPDLVCQLVPTSTSYRIDNLIRRLVEEGAVGEVLSVDLQRLTTAFPEFQGDLHWRHDREFSGLNTLNIGSTYESLMRWLGPGNRVMAMAKVHVPYRRNAAGELIAVAIPDHIDILFELANGAQVHLRASETTGRSPGNQSWIFGSEGTIYVDSRQEVFLGRRGDSELSAVANPPEGQAVYRVEEEFVNAVRGTEPVTMATFETGVRYMEWTEAVHRSSQTGATVYLPL